MHLLCLFKCVNLLITHTKGSQLYFTNCDNNEKSGNYLFLLPMRMFRSGCSFDSAVTVDTPTRPLPTITTTPGPRLNTRPRSVCAAVLPDLAFSEEGMRQGCPTHRDVKTGWGGACPTSHDGTRMRRGVSSTRLD